MTKTLPTLHTFLEQFTIAKEQIVTHWIVYAPVKRILDHHHIKPDVFASGYASLVFDYFIDVIAQRQVIGDCPVMASFLDYLKDRDISADELFVICSHFRKSMLESIYAHQIDTRSLLEEVGDIFDMNFTGVLKMYAERIYQKELELQKSVKLLNEYKNAIDAGAIVSKASMDGTITYASDNLTKLCGYSRDELIGKSHNILRHPDMPDLFFADLWKTIRQKRVFKGTIKNRKKDGTYFYLDSTIVPIVDPSDKIVEYMAIGYEVTTLIDARQQAVDAGLAKEYFLSNMSHEIRTPLNAILGFVTLLQDESTSSRHRKYLDIIHNSGENLLSIINDILDFSKLRSGEFTVEQRSFDLHEELSQTLELFTPIAREGSITLLSFIDPMIPVALISDVLRIKQILANLLSNAIKFTPANGTVKVEVTYIDGILRISVHDNGIGIAEEDQKKVFSAFLQTHESDGYVYGGTGLGLSICRQLAKHMDGEISVDSSLGQGSVFTLTLPVNIGTDRSEHCVVDEAISQIKVVILQTTARSDILTLLQRYLQACGVDVMIVDDISDREYEMLFFVDDALTPDQRKRIIDDAIPAIAITDTRPDRYESIVHVVTLASPLYFQKIQKAMSEVLGREDMREHEPHAENEQRRFKGVVLVAEDNAANQELIKILLQRYGLDYTMTSDGQQAFDAFKTDRFDMVLMDEQMPKMNGRDTMHAMIAFETEKGENRRTPIVALTANVIKGARERGLLAGYDAFLGKPLMITELESVFDQFLQEEKCDVVATDPIDNSSDVGDFDEERLLKTLMLRPDQLRTLLDVFKKKMEQDLPELEKAIGKRDLKKIARLAHSIKGSSANFRLRSVQKHASAMEEAAVKDLKRFDLRESFKKLQKELAKIMYDDRT